MTEGSVPLLMMKDAQIDRGGRRLLHQCHLTLGGGTVTALLGPSGSGKSSLLQAIAGLIPLSGGVLIVDGKRVDTMSRRTRSAWRLRELGYLQQTGDLLAELNVLDNVALPIRLQAGSASHSRAAAKAALERLRVCELADRTPETLSGGELQRVALARALVIGPRVLLADEPTGALDEATSITVMEEIVSQARNPEMATLIVTHDPLVTEFADFTLRLSAGSIVPA